LAIQYTISAESNLMFVIASGFDGSLKDVQEYNMAIIKSALERMDTLVLCDETQFRNCLNPLDAFIGAKFLAERWPGSIKLAIVINPTFINCSVFWEDAAISRRANIRVFQYIGEARNWLLSGQG